MNRPFTTVVLSVAFLTGVHAAPEAASASPPAKEATAPASGAAAAKARLLESVRADIKALKSADARSAEVESLTRFVGTLLGATPGNLAEPGGIETSLESYLGQGSPSEKTLEGYREFMRLTREELAVERRNAAAGAVRIGREVLGRAISPAVVGKGDTAEGEFGDLAEIVDKVRRLDGGRTPTTFSSLDSVLDQIRCFHQFRIAGDMIGMGRSLGNLVESLRRIPQLANGEEAAAHVENLRKQSGLPSPAELAQMPKQILAELIDEANQDKLDEIRAKAERYNTLALNCNEYYSTTGSTRTWQALHSLSTVFVQAVQQVRGGETPQFSAERFLREEPGGASLIPAAELMKRVRDYRVKVPDGNGGFSSVPLSYDPKEAMERIRTLGDISRELPILRRAVRSSDYSREGVEWNATVTTLESLAATHGKLASGESFVMAGDPGLGSWGGRGQVAAAQGTVVGDKLAALQNEMAISVLRRFQQSIPVDGKAAPATILAGMLEQAKADGRYAEIITLQQFATQFTPGAPLVPSADIAAIGHYLAGVRQDEELSEPRLATCFLQKAAMIHSNILPVEKLKARLQRLKKEFPEEYQKGTDDMLKGGTGEDYEGYFRRVVGEQIIVPAAK